MYIMNSCKSQEVQHKQILYCDWRGGPVLTGGEHVTGGLADVIGDVEVPVVDIHGHLGVIETEP